MNPHDEDDLNRIDDSQFDDLDDTSFDQDTLDEAGDDFGSEGEPWGDDDQDGGGYDDGNGDEPAQKKKSSLITYLLIGAVVLGAGGFGYVKFFGGSTPGVVTQAENGGQPLPPADRSSLNALRDQPGAQYMPTQTDAPPPPASGPKPQGGFMNAPADELDAPAGMAGADDPASLPIPGSDLAAPVPAPGLPDGGPSLTAVETPDVPPTEMLPIADKPALPTDPGVALLPGIKPTSDFPSVDLIKKAAPTAVEPPVTPETIAATPPTTTPVGVGAPVIPETVPEIPAMMAPTPVPTPEIVAPAPDTAATAEMQKKLTDAESRIAALEKELKDAKASAAAAAKANARPFETAPAVEPARIERPSRPQPAKTVRATPSRNVAKANEAAAPKPILKSNWELRSAQPGQAMVSTKNGKGDIRTVFVGDTLPGVGRIVAITQTPSGWVVRGTTATLHQ